MISEETIGEIKNRMDVYEVISDFVNLKKFGKEYRALSPFTNEKTPSFYVVPTKGFFKDFSSGKSGDAITFLMEHEKMAYPEALRYLAGKYGIEIKEEKRTNEQEEEKSEREALFIVMNFAQEFFHHQLMETEEGKTIGQNYFIHERKFLLDTIRKFGLGYATEAWRALTDAALQAGYSREMLDKAGLLVKKDESEYDRFRGRVTFPIHNLSGKVIGFGARILTSDKKQPKYLNSPETEIYHKSDVLYGLYQARHAIRKEDVCYLVEGYTDVISMHQAGVENVVSSSGTSLTQNQIKLIKRFTTNITLLFDGDEAGIRAAVRGVDMLLEEGMNVRVVLFPENHDPDSYAQRLSNEDFAAFLKNNAQDFIHFKVSLLSKEAADDPIKKSECIRDIVKSINLMPDPVTRSVYISETAKWFNVSEQVLLAESNKLFIQRRNKRATENEKKQDTQEAPPIVPAQQPTEKISTDAKVYNLERETIRLLLLFFDNEQEGVAVNTFLINEISDVSFHHPVYKKIWQEILEKYQANELVHSVHFIHHADEAVRAAATDFALQSRKVSPNWRKYKIFPEEFEKEAMVNHARRLKYWIIRLIQEQMRGQLKDVTDEYEELMILDKLFTIQEKEKELAHDLGIVVAA